MSGVTTDGHTAAPSKGPDDDFVDRRRGGKYLTFFLGREEYGLQILKVQEIIGLMDITPVPRTQHFIRGVINLRGKVIPIIDLRLKFGMDSSEPTDLTCIIVVEAEGRRIGIVVDRVSEVADIASEEIEAPPSFGAGVNTDYILGIGKSEGHVKLLLDIDQALSMSEMAEVEATAEGLGEEIEEARPLMRASA
jgi:purine-binding chemotaxis protein CheW